jgi:hypothetical protein
MDIFPCRLVADSQVSILDGLGLGEPLPMFRSSSLTRDFKAITQRSLLTVIPATQVIVDVYGPLSLDVFLFAGKTGRTAKRYAAVIQYINVIGKPKLTQSLTCTDRLKRADIKEHNLRRDAIR